MNEGEIIRETPSPSVVARVSGKVVSIKVAEWQRWQESLNIQRRSTRLKISGGLDRLGW